MQTVTINTIDGIEDYDIWVSEGCSKSDNKIYIATISDIDLPYTFTLPIAYQNTSFCVQIYDENECEYCECFGFDPSPTPTTTPTITPTISITPTQTPTPTPSGECLTPTYYHGSFTGNGFTDSATYTLSPTLYNGRSQWISPSNGTIRWNNFRWEVAGWTLGTVVFYNANTSTFYSPDTDNWVYNNCKPELDCNVIFTTEGCGEPLPTPSITPTVSITPSVTSSVTPSLSITPSITPSITVTPTNTPSTTPIKPYVSEIVTSGATYPFNKEQHEEGGVSVLDEIEIKVKNDTGQNIYITPYFKGVAAVNNPDYGILTQINSLASQNFGEPDASLSSGQNFTVISPNNFAYNYLTISGQIGNGTEPTVRIRVDVNGFSSPVSSNWGVLDWSDWEIGLKWSYTNSFSNPLDWEELT